MLKLPNKIYFGIPPKPERNRIVDYLKRNKFKKVIIPCSGMFTIAEAVVEAGIRPENIICGDTSLLSSVVGGYLSGNNTDPYEINSIYDFIDADAEPIDFLSQLIYAMEISKTPEKSYYDDELKYAIELGKEDHIQAIKDNLLKLRKTLNGVNFESIGTMDLINLHKDSPDNFIFVDTEVGIKEYDKMHDYGGAITGNLPPFEPFGTDEDISELFKTLGSAEATAMILKFKNKRGYNPDWQIHHISVDTKLNKKYLFLNRLGGEVYIDRAKEGKHQSLPYQIIGLNDTITKDSLIEVISIEREAAWYYRDLFSHKFGAGSARLNVLFLIDGKIASVRGFATPGLAEGGDAIEIYGIVYNNTKYRHLGRLVLRCITSNEFIASTNRAIFPITHVTTTAYKNYEGNRDIKGLGFETYSIEESEDYPGNFKMKHKAPITDKPFKEHLSDWLDEESGYSKSQTKKPKKERKSRGAQKKIKTAEVQ